MKYIIISFFLVVQFVQGQQDFSNQWEDLYSYNNIKDFLIVEDNLYAASENALFVYNLESKDINKISSVNGLVAEQTSTISFDGLTGNVIVGYENGLIQIVTDNTNVFPITGLIENETLISRKVNGFYVDQNFVLAYGDYGIIELNIKDREIGDFFTLSSTAEPLRVRKMTVHNNILYAATNKGLYSYNFENNLTLRGAENFRNWVKIIDGDINFLETFNNEVFFVLNNSLRSVTDINQIKITFPNSLNDLSFSNNNLVVTTPSTISFYNPNSFSLIDQIIVSDSESHEFVPKKTILKNGEVYVATLEFGILETNLSDKKNYKEIHPDGPFRNDAFSITVKNDERWITYGGHDQGSHNSLDKTLGINIFKNSQWTYLNFDEINRTPDCVKAIVDPFDSSRTLVASFKSGILDIRNNQKELEDNPGIPEVYTVQERWTNNNTNFILPGHQSVNQTWTANMIVDNNNMVWTVNPRAKERRFFSMYDGSREGVDKWVTNVSFLDVVGDTFIRGFNKMFVDQNNNVFATSARNGVFAFNANFITNEEARQRTVINSEDGKGNLISNFVHAVVVDENERVWIGTNLGVVVFDDYANLYSNQKAPAAKILIEEGGDTKEFLGDTTVRDIVIDNASNKWFATEGAGLFYTSSDAQTTFNFFNTSNSPLPSNTITDLELDESTGLLYIVTDKGVVVFDNKIEPFSDTLTSVVAYPNPALRTALGHEVVTIVSKDGNGIPIDTNVKILDVSGKLVFETNVLNDGSSIGGKIEWDKRNLRGNLVTSGIYIVLLSSPDGTENTTTKIAIVN